MADEIKFDPDRFKRFLKVRSVVKKTEEEAKQSGLTPDRTSRKIALITAEKQQKDIDESEKKRKEAEEISITDNLTGLKTKRLFDITLNQEMATVERDERSFPLELTIMDIDNFGTFNKEYGIPAGDEVLKMVGETINGILRTSDLAFRIGGEELAILSKKTHDPEKSGNKLISERYNEIIKKAQSKNGHKATVSIGQTDYVREESKKGFIDRANTALIVAKRLGKDRVVIGEVINGEEVYTDISTKKRYHVLKDADGKLLEIKEINING